MATLSLENNQQLTRAERRKRAAWYRSKEVLKWRFVAEYGVGNETTEVIFDIKATARDALDVASEKVADLVKADYGADMDGPEWINVKEFISLRK